MGGKWKTMTLDDVLSFTNGRASPDRGGGMPHPVYGSNGVIGFADQTNAEPETVIIGREGSYCGSLYFSKGKCWVTDNAIRANARDANEALKAIARDLVKGVRNSVTIELDSEGFRKGEDQDGGEEDIAEIQLPARQAGQGDPDRAGTGGTALRGLGGTACELSGWRK